MFSRHRELIAAGVFLLDGLWIAASWLAAYGLRFHVLPIPTPLGVPPLSQYLWIGAVITPVSLLVLLSLRLYRSTRTARLSQDVGAVLQGVLIVGALAALASYSLRGELARSVLVLFSLLAVATLCGSRVVARRIVRAMRRRGRNLRHVLLVGTGDPAAAFARKIQSRPEFGLAIEGMVAPDPSWVGRTLEDVAVIGSIPELPALVERTGAEIVYLALARSEPEAETAALEALADTTAAVRLVPDLARAFMLNASVEDFDGTPVVLITETPERGWASVAKRVFDIVASAALLVLLSPLLLAIAIWVKADSRGPVLYVQERVGMNGRRFRMIKFRTMRVDAEEEGEPGWTRPGDPRRTRAGAVLRPLSLDELPQLWNVLVGHMSLVGPRPERPVYVEQFRSSIRRYYLRHHMKAGITGWAQVNGLRGDTPLDRRIEYDLYYIQNWSMLFDLKILGLTALRVFRDRSAH
ncbi:MAG TPA: undecaprenyl-phosphate glucose phosphotransferase [Candidatus Eisenbacteria bacterium]|jgi:Undecaprenyl-phosphate glucose phosphotransferase